MNKSFGKKDYVKGYKLSKDNQNKLREALWLAELAEDDEIGMEEGMPVYSREFRENIMLYHKIAIKNMENHYRIGNRYYSRAALIIGFIVATFLLTTTAYAAYYYWVNCVMVDYNTHSSLTYELPKEVEVPTYLEEKYIPGYIPKGYELERMEWYDVKKTFICVAVYWNEITGMRINFQQEIINMDLNNRINTERAYVENIFVGEYQGFYVEENTKEVSCLIWNTPKYQFTITANICLKEEMISIASSLIEYEEGGLKQ